MKLVCIYYNLCLQLQQYNQIEADYYWLSSLLSFITGPIFYALARSMMKML